jgi:hypothetical protein
MKHFLFGYYSWFFERLKWISLCRVIQEIIPDLKDDKRFVDIWVFGNVLLAIFLVITSPTSYFPLIYGGFRLFEVMIVQINLLLFDQYRANKNKRPYLITSFRRTVLLLMHNYLEIIVWFALIYRHFQYVFGIKTLTLTLDSFWGSFYFSLVTMTTLGYGDITPKNTTGAIIVIIQTLIGIFMTLLLLARFVASLPRTESMDELENDTAIPVTSFGKESS